MNSKSLTIRNKILDTLDQQATLLKTKSSQKVPLSDEEIKRLQTIAETLVILHKEVKEVKKRYTKPGSRLDEDELLKYATGDSDA